MRLAAILLFGVGAASADEKYETHEFDSDGVKIRYTLEGQGDPVLLIHGSAASGNLNWRMPGTIGRLSDGYRIITMDARGHGASDRPGEGEYGVKMVDDVVRLLDHLEIESSFVVGYSMGGMITMKLMELHPKRVRAAVVCGMGWSDATDPRVLNVQPPLPNSRYAHSILQFRDLAMSRVALESIRVPFTVIVGTDDRLYERRVKPLMAVRPDVPVVLIDDASHVSCVFKGEFKDALRATLDEYASEGTTGQNDGE
jgi:pimeloyl-ACP methyl ester carboxylesterase